MYSLECLSPEHQSNWICPACVAENDKANFSCVTYDCDYIHYPLSIQPLEKHLKLARLDTFIQQELLIYGFIHESKINPIKIPTDIINVMGSYFTKLLSWNQQTHGDNVEFTRCKVVSSVITNKQSAAICISNDIIDAKLEQYKWEIKLIKCGDPVCMGFIIPPITDNIQWNTNSFGDRNNKNQIGILCFPYQTAIYPCALTKFSKRWSGRNVRRTHIPASVSKYDIFKFVINFIHKTCHIYQNNHIIKEFKKPLNIFPSNQSVESIIPAVLVCRGAKYCIQDVSGDNN
eukprot:38443_1